MASSMTRSIEMHRRTESPDTGASLELLVEKAKNGDCDALYDLCEKIARGVLFRAKYILGSEMDAEDVSQNVLIRVYEKIQSLREPKAFRVWLGSIIINESRQYMKEHARHGVVVDIEDYFETLPENNKSMLPYECAEDKDLRNSIMEAISRLPVRQREAVMLHYYDELSVMETSKAMSIPHQSVSRYISLACDKLRSEFEKKPYAKLGAASVPIDSLLFGILQSGAANFEPTNTLWLTNALLQSQQHAAHVAAVVTAGASSKVSAGIIIGALTSILVSGAVIISTLLGGSGDQPAEQVAGPPAEVSGRIVFSGGDNYRGTERVNPSDARPVLENAGSAETLAWWITSVDSDVVLFEGSGGNAENALVLLRETSENGEYRICYRVETQAGGIYRLESNFWIN